jgi:hypothetical protein
MCYWSHGQRYDPRALAICQQAALGDQLFIGKQYGIACDLQRSGQAAAGRQASTGRKVAGQDGFP